MPLPLLLLAGVAAGGFAKGGGLEGIIGSGKRKREEQRAKVDKRNRLYEYENFDYNQDVGYINNPYRDEAKKQQSFLQENIDRTTAGGINTIQQGGAFGATQALVNSQTQARRGANQQIAQIRILGNEYVETQRQNRISDKQDLTDTLLAKSEKRLAAAITARKIATQKVVKGITAGVTAAAGAAAGGIAAGGAAKSALLAKNPNATAAQLKAANRGAFGKGALNNSGLFSTSGQGESTGVLNAISGIIGGAGNSSGGETVTYGDITYQRQPDGTLTPIKS